MSDFYLIKKNYLKAEKRYLEILRNFQDNPEKCQVAQQLNDAWLEYKSAKVAFQNCSIDKRLGDLYGC